MEKNDDKEMTIAGFYSPEYERFVEPFKQMCDNLSADSFKVHPFLLSVSWEDTEKTDLYKELMEKANNRSGGWQKKLRESMMFWKCSVIQMALALKNGNDLCLYLDIDTRVDSINWLPPQDIDVGFFDNPVTTHKNRISAGWLWFRRGEGSRTFVDCWKANQKAKLHEHNGLTRTIKVTAPANGVRLKNVTGSLNVTWNGFDDTREQVTQ